MERMAHIEMQAPARGCAVSLVNLGALLLRTGTW